MTESKTPPFPGPWEPEIKNMPEPPVATVREEIPNSALLPPAQWPAEQATYIAMMAKSRERLTSTE